MSSNTGKERELRIGCSLGTILGSLANRKDLLEDKPAPVIEDRKRGAPDEGGLSKKKSRRKVDPEDENWEAEEQEYLDKEFGENTAKPILVNENLVQYKCVVCDVECNNIKTLKTHCDGRQHTKKSAVLKNGGTIEEAKSTWNDIRKKMVADYEEKVKGASATAHIPPLFPGGIIPPPSHYGQPWSPSLPTIFNTPPPPVADAKKTVRKGSLTGGNTGSLLQKLANCAVSNEKDSDLAIDVVLALLKSLKDFNHKRGEPEFIEILTETDITFRAIKTLTPMSKNVSSATPEIESNSTESDMAIDDASMHEIESSSTCENNTSRFSQNFSDVNGSSYSNSESIESNPSHAPNAYLQNQEKNNQTHGQYSGGNKQTYGQNPSGNSLTYGQNPSGNSQTYGQNPSGNSQTYGQNSSGNSQTYGQNSSGNSQTYGHNQGGNGQTYGQNLGGNGQTYGQNSGGNNQTYGQNPGRNNQTYGQNLGINSETSGKNEGGTNQTYGQNQGGYNHGYGQNHDYYGSHSSNDYNSYHNYSQQQSSTQNSSGYSSPNGSYNQPPSSTPGSQNDTSSAWTGVSQPPPPPPPPGETSSSKTEDDGVPDLSNYGYAAGYDMGYYQHPPPPPQTPSFSKKKYSF